MLNCLLNMKNGGARGRESNIGKCHAIAYGFLHLFYKYEVRKYIDFSCNEYVAGIPESDKNVTLFIAFRVPQDALMLEGVWGKMVGIQINPDV